MPTDSQLNRREVVAALAGIGYGATGAGQEKAAPLALPEFVQKWSIANRGFSWEYSLLPSRRMLGLQSDDVPQFDVFNTETGEFAWKQGSWPWPMWRPVSERHALFGWQNADSAGLALVDPETNNRVWQRSFPGWCYCPYEANGRALLGYEGGLMLIRIDDGTSIWDVPWDGSSSNSSARVVSGEFWAAWPAGDSKLIASAVELETGRVLWRIEAVLVNSAIPSVKAVFETYVVLSQLTGAIGNSLDALTAMRIFDGTPLWSKTWEGAHIIGETDESFWIVTQDGIFQRVNVTTGNEDWTVPAPLDSAVYGYMPNMQVIILNGVQAPGVWIYDAESGKQMWGDPDARHYPFRELTDSILLADGVLGKVHYRLVDLATGQSVLRSGTLEALWPVAEDRFLIATATEIEYINGKDGSLIDHFDLRHNVPAGGHVTAFGAVGPFIGLTVALDQSDDGDTITVFLDNTTFKPVATITLPKPFALDTSVSVALPLFVRNDTHELIGVG